MALGIIGAGLGRTGTMSLKLALEHLGKGPCYHMSEMLAGARRNLPLWLDAIENTPDWNTIFQGYNATTDYPACSYWEQLSAHFPDARVILTTRDADAWFDSVSATILHPRHLANLDAPPVARFIEHAVLADFANRMDDRAFMTAYFRKREAQIIAALPPERLLVLPVGSGWEPLCAFLGLPVPAIPYPRVNSGEEWQLPDAQTPPPGPEETEAYGRDFITRMRTQAFGEES